MDLKIFGVQLNIITIAISIFVGFIICFNTAYGCFKCSTKENFGLRGAPLAYNMSTGIPDDAFEKEASILNRNMYASLENNVAGQVPLPESQLFLFYNNKFSPDCCYKPQQYSSSTGCACISVEQMKYINSRGGNNTLPGGSLSQG